MTQELPDSRLKLIEATVAFANGMHPVHAFGAIVAETLQALRRHSLLPLEKAVIAMHRPRRPADDMVPERLWFRTQLLAISLRNAWLPAWREDKDVRRSLDEIPAIVRKKLCTPGPRGLLVIGLAEHRGVLEKFEVPLLVDAVTCAKDGLALVLSDYRGILDRVRICPYGAPGSVVAPPSKIDRAIDDLVASRDIHFFVDTRFIKGTRMRYCKPSHQRADYMRKFRAKQAGKDSEMSQPSHTRRKPK